MGPGEYYSVLLTRRRRQLAQLTEVLEIVAEEMPMNPTDTLEIAAGGIMANDPSFVLEIEKNSQLVAATVVEIGGWAGWLTRETTPKDPSRGRDMGLDDDDLALLEMGIDNDDIQAKEAEDTLRRYASSLFGTPWINEDAEIEGWEIGSRLLDRVRNGRQLTEKLLADLPLPSTPRVEKLLRYTRDARLDEAASTISYKWAQHLQATSQSYGDILHFLSLAAPFNHNARASLHETTTHLLEQSLLSSCPYPAEEDLDPRLKHLLSSPSECESEILRFELSGYAALRAFYDLRKSAPEAAVKALTAVIRAAGEPIDGGSWDRDWESPVEPTVLPAVLRELLGCADALGTADALDVCKVLTDWETCGENLRKVSVEVGPEGSWIDLGREGDVVKRVREKLCKVLARGWVN
ncbi:hypothetical protein BZA05DRAFT_330503 [Tricharina praecox]|uniref:uncharacterized protein n=1 Tax=Tricharina praecox TaxID=43433 RepID=UPI00221EA278|nr:uncharacterized protein BZA05DRAFT_330503 [Tricharina praecox]KAI5859037.1 hypothetical protein BZA05DRAFT_330503 [Tricharina praecox]